MLETYEKNSKKKLIATVVAVIVIAGVVVLADVLKSKDSAAETQTTSQSVATDSADTSTTPDTATSTSTDSSGVKDGTYSATESYSVPPGQESIKVSLTLSGGTITDVSVVNSGNDRESAEFQNEFASSYKSQVVGQKISGLQISSVAGASDTTDGFNQALSQIAAQAQA